MSTSRIFPRRLILAAAGIGLAGSLLTGCAGGTPALSAGSAAELQNGVLAVSTASAAGDFATAQAELGTVQATLDAASAGDTVTAARATEIQAAIDLVAADLTASIAADVPVETPTETPVETTAPEPVSTPDDSVDEDADEDADDSSDDSGDDSGEDETTTPTPTEPVTPGKDKTETGACVKKDKCD